MTQRLLQIAAGLWPEGATGAPAATAGDMIESTLSACLSEDHSSSIAALQQLLCEATPLVASQAAQQLGRQPSAWQSVCAVCQVRCPACCCCCMEVAVVCRSALQKHISCPALMVPVHAYRWCCHTSMSAFVVRAVYLIHVRMSDQMESQNAAFAFALTAAPVQKRHQALSARAQEVIGNQFSYHDGTVAREVAELQDAVRLFESTIGQQAPLQPQRQALQELQRSVDALQARLDRGY